MPIEFDLPVVTAATSPKRVIDRMREAVRHAVIVDLGSGTFRVIQVEDVLEADKRGLKRVGDFAAGGLKVARPAKRVPGQATDENVGKIFGPSRARYVLRRRLAGGRAEVVSRRELWAHPILGAGTVCICPKCRYACDSPPGRQGGQCPNCEPGHLDCF